jgi:hypothetical protein
MTKRPYIRNSNLAVIQELESRQENARYILKCIAKSKSNWFISEMIRNLYFYLDFDFVKGALKHIYITTTSDKVKAIIRDLHDGTLDVSDLVKQAEHNSLLLNESQKLQHEYENSEDETEESSSFDNSSLKVLRYTSKCGNNLD